MRLLSRFFTIVLLCLCQGISTPAHAEPLNVVASFSILGDLVEQVGGDAVSVDTLVGADSDAHIFQPTPSDAKKIAQARIVFINGGGFEGWIERLVTTTQYKGTIVEAIKGIPSPIEQKGMDTHHGHKHSSMDPHAWQNISNTRVYIKNITQALCDAEPNQAILFKKNAAKLDHQLAELDAKIKEAVKKIPETKRVIITSHDAFKYFEQAYGIRFIAPVGLSTAAEPTPKDIQSLIKLIKDIGAKTLFIENISSGTVMTMIAKESGAHIGKTLYADALSRTDGPASNYQAMMQHNFTSLFEAMQANSPTTPEPAR